jgi:ergothioneine biosynthesis protein EgtB
MSIPCPSKPSLLADDYQVIRQQTMELARPLSVEDQQVQSMMDVSPVKWHKAHTSWFFETFILEKLAEYRPFNSAFRELYNSYYVQVGPRCIRHQRGWVTRPSLEEVHAYRDHVDAGILRALENGDLDQAALDLVWLGLQHEQQHQELILMDIQHVLSQNPLGAAYRTENAPPRRTPVDDPSWVRFDGGLVDVGHGDESFAYDNEGPRHRVYLEDFELAAHPVSNAQWMEFLEDGGYDDPTLWLDDAWALLQEREDLRAPMYWRRTGGQWLQFTLHGWEPLRIEDPAVHISYYEADAFARWSGQRLPTEFEWEHAARSVPMEGNFVEDAHWYPRAGSSSDGRLAQIFGDVWEWTQSAYAAYPGYRPAPGAVGEYNGKFMVNQYVLRGGCFATPRAHIRPTYRNFFHPYKRWHFGGMRLARAR